MDSDFFKKSRLLTTDCLCGWANAYKKQKYANWRQKRKLPWSKRTPNKGPFQQLWADNLLFYAGKLLATRKSVTRFYVFTRKKNKKPVKTITNTDNADDLTLLASTPNPAESCCIAWRKQGNELTSTQTQIKRNICVLNKKEPRPLEGVDL